MVTEITSGITVTVETFYQEKYSSAARDEYFFAYQIMLQNCNKFMVQLLRRHWIITNGYALVEEVKGEGVVGEQPILFADENYEYGSGCNLTTPIGTMHGTYTFINVETSEEFEVKIPKFQMEAPTLLN